MCRAFDVTPRALRFYEQKELLSPIRHTSESGEAGLGARIIVPMSEA